EAYYVVGFVDGRGTFKVGRGDNAVRFETVSEDRSILEDLRDYFGVGRVSILKKSRRGELYRYLVTGEDDLLKIVEFFDRFPPIVRREEYSRFRERVQKSMDVERRILFLRERREIYKLYTLGIKVEDIMKKYGISKQRDMVKIQPLSSMY
ncbi:MAG: LAGLIDADG family homing endonuclease, partial [Candidatus Methylarchaceae archaeon HK01M]|nr:LAGLIDADG family homing endonuclease [Candidatus Methylarchaceae archaeon HK01M]